MIKIQFLLKKPNNKQEGFEYITIADPKIDKTRKFDWGYRYVCEVYFSDTKKVFPHYGINPIDTLCSASEIAKIYCQNLLKNGCIISEVENQEPWRLEKLSDSFVQDRINQVKNSDIPQEYKDKILEGVDKVL